VRLRRLLFGGTAALVSVARVADAASVYATAVLLGRYHFDDPRGRGVAVLYGTEPRNGILVLQIGASAPLIIKTLAEATVQPSSSIPTPPVTPGFNMGKVGRPSLLNFLAGR
jgi:hypothetical protein